MDIQKLVELHKLGKTDSEIAKIMSISRQSVTYFRNKLGLKSNFSYNSFRKMNYEEVEKLVKENKTDKEIAQLFGVKPIAIYYFRKRNNVKRDNLLINKPIKLTKRQLSILTGTLLGDGSLRKTNINPSFSCEHGIKQLEYCKWKYEELKTLNAKFNTYKRKTIDKRNNKLYESAACKVPTNSEFLPLYNNLYIDGKKRITKEFLKNFDELSLAVMFMDDGYKVGKTIGIATNCFSLDELKLFKNFLLKRFCLDFTIRNNRTLYLPTIQYPYFEELVLPYMHSSLLYKLSLNSVNLGTP